MASYTPESLFRGDKDLQRYEIHSDFDLTTQSLQDVDKQQDATDGGEASTGTHDIEFYNLKDQVFGESKEI